jgi:hypothetical protein
MFRRVDLPTRVAGRLLLHSMPGRYEVLENVWDRVRSEKISGIVCLAERDEIRLKSVDYGRALESQSTPCPVLIFEVPDREAAGDRFGFWKLARDVAARLTAGDIVLVHCAGGVGRTAMLAVCVLIALGEAPGDARSAVSRAGSTVETSRQSELIAWCAEQSTDRSASGEKKPG